MLYYFIIIIMLLTSTNHLNVNNCAISDVVGANVVCTNYTALGYC